MGYSWDGMQKVNKEEAIKLYKANEKDIYLLYPDDSEGLVERLGDILEAGPDVEFGYEKSHW